jgi:hypothetical protein
MLDQKKQIALSIGSFFLMSERTREMHWSKLQISQSILFLADTLINQSLQPRMIDGQFLMEVFLSQRFGCILECLKGILLVSTMIALLGSESPIGPKKILCKLSSRGMNIWFDPRVRKENEKGLKEQKRSEETQEKEEYLRDVVDGRH